MTAPSKTPLTDARLNPLSREYVEPLVANWINFARALELSLSEAQTRISILTCVVCRSLGQSHCAVHDTRVLGDARIVQKQEET
jgi:hypothetical protein